MNNTLLKQYADIKIQIKDLTEQAKDMEGKVMKEMDKEDVQTASYEFGTFSTMTRTNWEYSAKLNKLEENQKMLLDAAKKTEKEDGTAKATLTKGLMFRQTNEK